MQPTDLTPLQQAKQAKSWERYARIYSEVEAEYRAEWAREFGDDSDSDSQFELDGCSFHRETMRRVELEQRHEAEDRDEYVASGLY